MNRHERRRAAAEAARPIFVERPKDPPETLDAYRAWVLGMANHILNQIEVDRDAHRELEQLVAMVNALPTRFLVVSKVDHNEETWTFDVVPRLASRVPLLGRPS